MAPVRPKIPNVVMVKVRISRLNAVLDFISTLFHSPSGLADGLALKEFALRVVRFAPEAGSASNGSPDPVDDRTRLGLQIPIYR